MMRCRRGGVVRTVGRTAVVASTANAVAGGVSKRRTNKQIAKQEETAASQQAGDDTMAELQRLGDMKSQELLTDEAFAAAKTNLLGT